MRDSSNYERLRSFGRIRLHVYKCNQLLVYRPFFKLKLSTSVVMNVLSLFKTAWHQNTMYTKRINEMYASGIGATGHGIGLFDWFYVISWATCMVVGCTKAVIKWYKNRGKPKQPKPVYKVPTYFQ